MKANLSMTQAIKEYLPLFAVLAAILELTGYYHVFIPPKSDRTASKPPQAPVETEMSKHGRALFLRSCAHCHGDDARGSGSDEDGPDLYRLRISDARIAAVIRGGIPDEMPSFAKKHSSQDVADLTAYLRSLR